MIKGRFMILKVKKKQEVKFKRGSIFYMFEFIIG